MSEKNKPDDGSRLYERWLAINEELEALEDKADPASKERFDELVDQLITIDMCFGAFRRKVVSKQKEITTSKDPRSLVEALNLLRSLGAPPRLVLHGEIVSEVAAAISHTTTRLGVTHDELFVVVGAALHDAGKIAHPEELTGTGREHEPAGEQLLLQHGLSPRLAKVCRTHGSWDQEAVSLEELLIAMADHLWKGTRGEQIERLVIDHVATRLGLDRWETFLRLDPVFEQIAADAPSRLARARVDAP